LRESGKIGSAIGELSPSVPLRFYFSRRCRYWKRKAEELRQNVLTFSGQAFARALGVQGELMIDAGLPRTFVTGSRHLCHSLSQVNLPLLWLQKKNRSSARLRLCHKV
jgi:hypothetical protein